MSGHPTDNDTAPSSGSLTPVSGKDAAKNEIKVGRGLSFLFSLLKVDPGLTLLSASPSPSVIERLCVCWSERGRGLPPGGAPTHVVLLLWCSKGGKTAALFSGFLQVFTSPPSVLERFLVFYFKTC